MTHLNYIVYLKTKPDLAEDKLIHEGRTNDKIVISLCSI